jgi:hypothetical protein
MNGNETTALGPCAYVWAACCSVQSALKPLQAVPMNLGAGVNAGSALAWHYRRTSDRQSIGPPMPYPYGGSGSIRWCVSRFGFFYSFVADLLSQPSIPARTVGAFRTHRRFPWVIMAKRSRAIGDDASAAIAANGNIFMRQRSAWLWLPPYAGRQLSFAPPSAHAWQRG